MTKHRIVSQEEWTQARRAHLAKEKQLTRQRDELARERRYGVRSAAYHARAAELATYYCGMRRRAALFGDQTACGDNAVQIVRAGGRARENPASRNR